MQEIKMLKVEEDYRRGRMYVSGTHTYTLGDLIDAYEVKWGYVLPGNEISIVARWHDINKETREQGLCVVQEYKKTPG